MTRGDRVSASVFVEAPPAVAFEVFAGQIDLWWRHGLKFRAGGRSLSVLHLEPCLGGRLFESIPVEGGEARVIHSGTVVEWDPPLALRIEWRGVNFAPHEKTEIAVSFAPRAAGTLVTLVHSGFAALPPDHPVRHGQPVDVFIGRMAMWWSDQMGSLRALVAGGPGPAAAAAPDCMRRARAADAPALARLYAELVSNPALDVQPARLAELEADPRTALLVFERGGALLGTVLVSLCADAMFGRRPFAVVENIVVAAAARGRGIGASLLREVERICIEADCSKIMLLSAAQRADAHAFFERCGYDGGKKRGFVKYRAAFDPAAAR